MPRKIDLPFSGVLVPKITQSILLVYPPPNILDHKRHILNSEGRLLDKLKTVGYHWKLGKDVIIEECKKHTPYFCLAPALEMTHSGYRIYTEQCRVGASIL